MSEYTLFRNLTLNGKPLAECELIRIEAGGGDYRLYADVDGEDASFSALAVCYAECSFDGPIKDDVWGEPGLMVEVIFEVEAYWDGVRHLHVNRRAGGLAGYINYPNMSALVEILQAITKLEHEVCSEYGQ